MIQSSITQMGRISVEFVVANNRDVVNAGPGTKFPEAVPHVTVRGVIDTGAARLVLPQWAADKLSLERSGELTVRYADNRTASRPRVTNVWLQLCGREGVFSASIEPDRQEALIGAIVLEELDLIVDCPAETVHPRDPDRIIAEIE